MCQGFNHSGEEGWGGAIKYISIKHDRMECMYTMEKKRICMVPLLFKNGCNSENGIEFYIN